MNKHTKMCLIFRFREKLELEMQFGSQVQMLLQSRPHRCLMIWAWLGIRFVFLL